MIAKYWITGLLGLALLLQAGLPLGQNLRGNTQSSADLVLEGEITYINPQRNRFVVGDQSFRLKEVVRIDNQQRLAQQAYRRLSTGARVSITLEGKNDQGYPLVVSIRTQTSP